MPAMMIALIITGRAGRLIVSRWTGMGVALAVAVGVELLPIGCASTHRDADRVVGPLRSAPRRMYMDESARCVRVGGTAVGMGRVDPRKTCHHAQREKGQKDKGNRKVSAPRRSAPVTKFWDNKNGPEIDIQCSSLRT